MKRVIVYCTLSISVLCIIKSPSVLVDASTQRGFDYYFPFRADENWQTDGDYGLHLDSTGIAIDFYARDSLQNEVLAPSDGYMRIGCTVNGAASVIFDTTAGDTFRFVHMVENSLPVSGNTQLFVRKGEIIGKITGAGAFERTGCKMSSDGPHIHFSWSRSSCNFVMQGFTFDCGGVYNCAGIGVYNTYCNRKYLNTRFISRNRPPIAGCKERVYTAHSAMKQSDTQELQKCLISLNLLDSRYQTGIYGSLTSNGVFFAKRLFEVNPRCMERIHSYYVPNETNYSTYLLQNCLIKYGFLANGYNTWYFGSMTSYGMRRARQALDVIYNERI